MACRTPMDPSASTTAAAMDWCDLFDGWEDRSRCSGLKDKKKKNHKQQAATCPRLDCASCYRIGLGCCSLTTQRCMTEAVADSVVSE